MTTTAVTVPELFERHVATTPDAVAIVTDGGSLTYREVDGRAARLATALAARGIGPETVVGLAMARSAELWIAVLAVLKAGGAFLPLDTAYPADRIAYMLGDSGARLVLVDDTTAAELPALTVPVLHLADLAADTAGPATTARTAGAAGNLAYVIYTSGSTGRPKGVAVTHRGLADLLATHIDRLKVTDSSRVLQFASPSFDASVWEMCMGLLSGAAFVVVGRDDLAAGDPLAATIDRHGVTHVTLPPPVLAALPAGSMATVETLVVAGEATGPELADRWSIGRRMINAYGPTETTVCATMSGPLAGDGRMPPIGHAVAGSRVHVLDAVLNPVADGVTGELYVSGASLARGYLGRSDLTAHRFVACPSGTPGERMYRTGDLVERTPDGDLVFHGRVDTQVKIRGFRIEPLEIEAVLMSHPGIANAAVIAREAPSGAGRHLVAYVIPATSAAGPAASGVYGNIALDSGFGPGELRRFAAGRLPDFMVPTAFVVLDRLPLTPNGKLDRAALPEPEVRGGPYRAPETPVERLLAGLFAEALGTDRVGLDDDFFVLGGDSIQSIRLVGQARAQGIGITARQVFEHRTVAGLAGAVATTGTAARPEELPGGGTGLMPLLPVAQWIRGWGPGFERFLQAMVLDLPDGVDTATLTATLAAIVDRHDVLRARLVADDGGSLLVAPPGAVDVAPLLRRVPCDADWSSDTWHRQLARELDAAAGRLDPAAGVVAQFVWFSPSGRPGRLLVALHHLVVDGVSWRILLPDLDRAWQAVRDGTAPDAAPAGTSMRRWAHGLRDAATDPARVAELDFWRSVVDGPDPLLGARRIDPARDVVATLHDVRVELPVPATDAVLRAVPTAYRGRTDDVLLTALALAVARWRGARGVAEASVLVRMEGHGREESVVPGVDLSGTLGWFTSVYPVRLALNGIDVADALTGGPAAAAALKAVKEQLRAVPDKGIGYGLLRHLNPETAPVLEARPIGQVGFNYLGRFPGADTAPAGAGFTQATDVTELAELDAAHDPRMPAAAEVDINAGVVDTPDGPRLGARFTAPAGVLDADALRELADLWITALHGLVACATRPGAGGLTPSDVPLVRVTQAEIDDFQRQYPGLADIWPATPLQAGLLFHSTLAEGAFDPYQVQYALHLDGTVEPERLRRAAQALLDRTPSLRAAFVPDTTGDPVQLIVAGVALPWRYVDLADLDGEARSAAFELLLDDDRSEHFVPTAPPMLRLTLVRLGPERFELVLTAHHVLFDGWSVPLLVQDLLRLYGADGDGGALPPARSYRDFLAWRAEQDDDESARVWRGELAGVDGATRIHDDAEPDTAGGMGKVDVPLDAAEARALTRCAARLGVTLNTVVQGGWGLLLGLLTGRRDVVFATTVAGRPPAVAGVDAIVGTFLNTLPVRVRFSPADTVGELLTGLQARQATVMDHHHYGLAEIHRVAGVEALFDTIIGFESFPMDRAGIVEASAAAGFAVTGIRSFTASHYPVTLLVFVEADHPRLVLQYLCDAFDPEAARDLAGRFATVLRQMLADTGGRVAAVDALAAGERTELSTVDETGPAPVPALFGRSATPDAVAVTGGPTTLTHGALDARADRLACGLRERGIGTGQVVAALLPDPADLVTALLGVARAGAVLLPLAPGDPDRYLADVVADAGPVLLLTSGRTLPVDVPPAGIDDLAADGTPPAVVPGPAAAAYLTYGSGPDGVVVTHGALAERVAAIRALSAEVPAPRVSVRWPADAHTWVPDVVATLAAGGTLDLHPGSVRGDGWTGDVISLPPSGFPDLLDEVAGAIRAGTVVFSGDVLPADLERRVARAVPGARVVHAYATPETGRTTGPTTAARGYLLGAGLAPVPPGAVGEIYVCGPALARGYRHAGRTAARFVADPYGPPGARMFRTGDRARRTADGRWEPVGRGDRQFVRRGVRIDPATIEAVLLTGDGVSHAFVVTRADRLVAYVVTTGPPTTDLAAFVAARLPAALVPDAVVHLDHLPARPDPAALPEPAARGPNYRAPRTPTEVALCALFVDVLGAARVGIDDDFFALGGNSLLATRLTSRIRKVLGVSVPIREIFQNHTIAELSRTVASATTSTRPRLRTMDRSAQS